MPEDQTTKDLAASPGTERPGATRIVHIADSPEVQSASVPRQELPGWVAALLPLLILGGIFGGIAIVLNPPDSLFSWAFGLLVAAGLTWVLVSSFFPAKPDRVCPQCGSESLRRLDPRSTAGVVCSACGYRDETASSFLMAESEGPLESIVLDQRERKRTSPRSLVSETRSEG